MDNGDKEKIRNAVIEALIVVHEAQTRALHQLRKKPPPQRAPRKRVGTSQLDLVEDILEEAGKELHINEIIQRVEKRHGVRIERESVVSALSKKVLRGERFVRSAKNTFGLTRREQ